jgi:hypothetical protein
LIDTQIILISLNYNSLPLKCFPLHVCTIKARQAWHWLERERESFNSILGLICYNYLLFFWLLRFQLGWYKQFSNRLSMPYQETLYRVGVRMTQAYNSSKHAIYRKLSVRSQEAASSGHRFFFKFRDLQLFLLSWFNKSSRQRLIIVWDKKKITEMTWFSRRKLTPKL